MNDNSPIMPSQLLKTEEAARFLAISPRTLWGLTASGQIPRVRIGRCVRYRYDDLQHYIDVQTKGGAE